jgi:small GTP-binding protein
MSKSSLLKLSSMRPHKAHIWNLAWSPVSDTLASCSGDWTVQLWDNSTNQRKHSIKTHNSPVTSISWSPDGQRIISASRDGSLVLTDGNSAETVEASEAFLPTTRHSSCIVSWSPDGRFIALSQGNSRTFLLDPASLKPQLSTTVSAGTVRCLAWSPDSSCVAMGTSDGTIYIWNTTTNRIVDYLVGHNGAVLDLSWSNANNLLASASSDETVRVWNPAARTTTAILEGHTNSVFAVAFSPSGNLLISRSQDNTYRLWRLKSWDVISTIKEASYINSGGIAFHPHQPLLALKGVSDDEISIWRYHEEEILEADVLNSARYYVNARVVLTGDTGVGKTGLSIVMTGKRYVPTDSTHSRKIWTLDSHEETLPSGVTETREMLLWDLAGQPGYRLIHQLYLTEVAVALIVFDSRSETDPFSGVRHWARALRLAQRIANSPYPTKMILVAARCDRGGLSASRRRVASLVQELGFDNFIETSAKEGIGVAALLSAISDSVDWGQLPRVSSNALFQSIKQYLFSEKQLGRVIVRSLDLFEGYLRSGYAVKTSQDPQEEFETCIRLVESRGLIRRLSFGNLVLLQPELVDAYTSSMIEAAKQEPDGLGSIKEMDAREGRFFVPSEIRLKDQEDEKLLCIATVESLIRHELALRQDSNGGTFLVFPSQFTRNWDEAPHPSGAATKYIFEGPIANIYARLVVRLSHSGVFSRRDTWRNACSFIPTSGKGLCGVYLQGSDEGKAELTIFYGEDTRSETKGQFDEFVGTHLRRHALEETIERQHIIQCDACGEQLPPKAIRIRMEKGIDWISCPVCDKTIKLVSAIQESDKWHLDAVARMDQTADVKRDLAAAISVIQGKRKTQDYDVFLSYRSTDLREVVGIANKLKERGILPWLDVWELRPGLPWQKQIEKVISKIGAAAILIGPTPLTEKQLEDLETARMELRWSRKDFVNMQQRMREDNLRLGPWQDIEVEALLREFVRRGCPVIPVILTRFKGTPKLPGFLESMAFVDMRKTDPDPLQMLSWGITGKNWQAREL